VGIAGAGPPDDLRPEPAPAIDERRVHDPGRRHASRRRQDRPPAGLRLRARVRDAGRERGRRHGAARSHDHREHRRRLHAQVAHWAAPTRA
jgi:hypothetical protein